MIDQEGLKSIEKLHEMKANGILSEAEFEEAKRVLLAGKRSARKAARVEASVESEGNPAENDFVAWALLPLKRYAQFDGRSRRREFWSFGVAVVGALSVLAIVFTADTDIFGNPGGAGILAALLFAFVLLATLIPTLAVQARRFHDQGRSGWLVLLNIIPYVGGAITLILMLFPGEEGENQYGLDPKE